MTHASAISGSNSDVRDFTRETNDSHGRQVGVVHSGVGTGGKGQPDAIPELSIMMDMVLPSRSRQCSVVSLHSVRYTGTSRVRTMPVSPVGVGSTYLPRGVGGGGSGAGGGGGKGMAGGHRETQRTRAAGKSDAQGRGSRKGHTRNKRAPWERRWRRIRGAQVAGQRSERRNGEREALSCVQAPRLRSTKATIPTHLMWLRVV